MTNRPNSHSLPMICLCSALRHPSYRQPLGLTQVNSSPPLAAQLVSRLPGVVSWPRLTALFSGHPFNLRATARGV